MAERQFMRWAGVAALTVSALLVAGCGTGGEGSQGPAGTDGPRSSEGPAKPGDAAKPGDRTPPTAVPAALTGQELQWGDCESGPDGSRPDGAWECAEMRAPRDWARPGGPAIGIELVRAESTGGSASSESPGGSLFFNFGGPGGSGVTVLPALADRYGELRKHYDLVSFDPRGVARSEGIRCRDDAAAERAESVDATPDDAAEERAYLADAASFAKGCAANAGKLLPYLSTEQTARDMDLMRTVLGDKKLNYFGISYGTELGGTYAHLFPDRTGRLVLDAVVDPTADSVGHAENQARGFQRALNSYLRSTGEDPRRGTARISRMLDFLDAEPLPGSGGRELHESSAWLGIVAALYSEESRPLLRKALDRVAKGDGALLLSFADHYNGRDEKGRYDTQGHSQRAISCRDSRARPSLAEAEERLPAFEKISPVFGRFLVLDTAGWCHGWPVEGLHDRPEVSAPGASPVLVVGNTGDPATPYEGARKMADALGRGVGTLLTWHGEGHGAYGAGSDCVDRTVNAYLLDARVPEDGTECG